MTTVVGTKSNAAEMNCNWMLLYQLDSLSGWSLAVCRTLHSYELKFMSI